VELRLVCLALVGEGAIAQGKGSSEMIVEKIRHHEKTLVELDTRIANANALIEPLVVPAAASKLADYVTGSASIFREDDHARNRTLVERVLDKILVYPSGEVVLVFHRDSLFAPVVSATMTGSGKGVPRAEHQEIFNKLKKGTDRDARVWVHQNGDRTTYAATTGRVLAADEGSEWFELADDATSGGSEIALATPTGQGRDFVTDRERALATPTGSATIGTAPMRFKLLAVPPSKNLRAHCSRNPRG
jgi:hypothetical protein